MDSFFGGKHPFDHPFFTQPFSGLFGGKSPFDDPFPTSPFGNPFFNRTSDNQSGPRKQITIEELDPENDDALPNNVPGKEVSVKNSNEYPIGTQCFSFQRTTYGGPDGVYYTSSVGQRTGGDGVFLMEVKEDDRTVGESLHTISKGIHEKGHSVTTKQFSDGKVDSMQTLHNLQEDELAGFQENWKMNAEKVLPGWNDGFNLLENAGVNNLVWDDDVWKSWVGYPHHFLENLETGGAQSDNGESWGPSSRGTSRKNVPIE